MNWLILLSFSFFSLYAVHPGFNLHQNHTIHHEDIYVGQIAEMHGISVVKERSDFSFRVDNQREIISILEKNLWGAQFASYSNSPTILLACYINGMNVLRSEFDRGISMIHDQLKEKIPLIGLYNASRGFISDVQRLAFERKGIESISKVGVQNFLEAAFEYFSKAHPHFLILMIVHSEGGLLLDQAIDGLGEYGKEMAKKHLLIRTFGSVQAIAKEKAVDVLNIYSDNDHAAFPFVQEKFHLPSYAFRFYQPASHIIGNTADHAFLGVTYQDALSEQIEALLNRTVLH